MRPPEASRPRSRAARRRSAARAADRRGAPASSRATSAIAGSATRKKRIDGARSPAGRPATASSGARARSGRPAAALARDDVEDPSERLLGDARVSSSSTLSGDHQSARRRTRRRPRSQRRSRPAAGGGLGRGAREGGARWDRCRRRERRSVSRRELTFLCFSWRWQDQPDPGGAPRGARPRRRGADGPLCRLGHGSDEPELGGYATVSRDSEVPVSFTSATGTWTQPAAKCAAGDDYSEVAIWVGIGGFSSERIEQVGTQIACNARIRRATRRGTSSRRPIRTR